MRIIPYVKNKNWLGSGLIDLHSSHKIDSCLIRTTLICLNPCG